MNKYGESVMRRCRMVLDIEPDDTSKDDIINSLTPHEAFEYCLNWEGIMGYSDIIIEFIEDCYDIYLEG